MPAMPQIADTIFPFGSNFEAQSGQSAAKKRSCCPLRSGCRPDGLVAEAALAHTASAANQHRSSLCIRSNRVGRMSIHVLLHTIILYPDCFTLL